MAATLADLATRITLLESQLDSVVPIIQGFQATNAALQTQLQTDPTEAAAIQKMADEMDAHSASFKAFIATVTATPPATQTVPGAVADPNAVPANTVASSTNPASEQSASDKAPS